MIVVHHLNNSRSQRVLWLLEELGLPYEVKRYQRNAKTMLAPPELKAIHPLGKSPVITDGGQTVAETGAIIEYLLETYGQGRLIPAAGTPERLRFTYWLHYAEGSAMSPLLLKLVFANLPKRAPFLLKGLVGSVAAKAQSSFIDPQLKTHVDYWEAELGKADWFAGSEFSAADVQMSFPVEVAAVRVGFKGRPKLQAFLERIQARPAYQRALERGGLYKLG
ncbi:glutathione S-transferase family protein [Caulobacter sp. 17J80-11]|uniref:glutathione S-transferase family protein n=1 Tax=Caulobacter sp. 17J80-11 TaxID=2763502 RepID=UPI001653CDBC|nr:glutathione S-transferase [Caulobacter sp. 17J80-11]MBC6980498.1 glutathione S-transferase [Caulobacter sp. 17J80-11]